MERRMVLLLNICLVGSFYLMANGASPDEMALRNAVASAGAAIVVLTTDITLTASLPELTGDKVLIVIGRCGKWGKDKCVLSGGNYYALFHSNYLYYRGSLTLENLVITATANAAVRIRGPLKLNKVTFVDNYQALYLSCPTGTITNSQFLRHNGVAIEAVGEPYGLTFGASRPDSLLKFVNCIFSRNRRAMTVRDVAVSITNSQFTQNVQNTASGGAIYMYLGRATISDSRFSQNTAARAGGAIYIYGSTLEAVNVKFEENVANGNVRGGGAVAIDGKVEVLEAGDAVWTQVSRSRATFEKCSFANNKARNAFGGAFSLSTYADVVFCKSTFSGNTGKRGKASNGYVVAKRDCDSDDGCAGYRESAMRSILTNPLVTIPAVQRQKTFFSPPVDVAYGRGTCKSSFSQHQFLTFANIQKALEAFLRNFPLEEANAPLEMS